MDSSLSSSPTPPKKRRIGLYLLTIVIVLIGGVLFYKHYANTGEEQKSGGSARGANTPQPVQAAPVVLSSQSVYLSALGTVTAANTAVVKSRVGGLLQKINFKEGETVKAGQLLAEIDPRPFEVKLAQAQGLLAKDQAQLASARSDLARYKTLLAQSSISAQQVDTQTALVRQLEGTAKSDQAQVDSAQLQLTYSRVTAPISGQVGLRAVDVGNMVQSTDTNGIVTITQVNPINVIFTVPENSLQSVIKPMRKGKVLSAEAWDRAMLEKLGDGKLVSLDNQIDTATGTIKLKAEFTNDSYRLFPNQFVNIRLKTQTLNNVLVAPVAAIQKGSQGDFVFVVNMQTGQSKPQTVSLRLVKTGARDANRVVILEGVKQGDQLVTDGADRLREGAPVEVVDSKKVLDEAASAPKSHQKRKRQN